jgi:hypothetical protein
MPTAPAATSVTFKEVTEVTVRLRGDGRGDGDSALC